MTRIAFVLVALTTTPSLAEAQTASSFDQLGLLVNQGDRIAVTDRAGQELQGRLVDLSPATLSLLVDNLRHDLQEAEISVVRRRQRDSLKNGALLGFMSGAVVATSLMAGDCAWSCYPVAAALYTSLFGAAGAGIGAGLDALKVNSQIVFGSRRPAQRLHPDSVTNGAALGFASGVSFGGIAVLNWHQPYNSNIGMGMAFLYGAIGAGIGAGVDLLIQRADSRAIHESSRSSRRIAVSPLLSRSRRGVALSLGF